ncbi:MAG: class I SAM-dependent methyltransferase [Gammaproteobacteria bacterium]
MTGISARDEADAAVHHWYDANAERFADAAAIEVPFIGLSADAQERMNRFKLFAIDNGVALEGKNVLEFGAGHGRLALAYPSMASYLGVDYSANLVALGTQRLARAGLSDRARLVHDDVLSFAETMAAFDVVCSLGMLSCFPDPEPVLRKMSAYLKPGGILFTDFRCTSRLYGAIRRLKWAIKKPTGGGVLHPHLPSAIEAMLAKVGLTDIQVVSREFPLLAGLHARQGWDWPLALRNAIADSRGLRMFATVVWVFGTKRA